MPSKYSQWMRVLCCPQSCCAVVGTRCEVMTFRTVNKHYSISAKFYKMIRVTPKKIPTTKTLKLNSTDQCGKSTQPSYMALSQILKTSNFPPPSPKSRTKPKNNDLPELDVPHGIIMSFIAHNISVREQAP